MIRSPSSVHRFAHTSIAGAGLGLRGPHLEAVLESRPAVRWFEILTDNFLAAGGPLISSLEAVRRDYPITMHSVGLSLGSTDPLDWDYLAKLKDLAERFEPAWVSEHLCWSSVHGVHLHDLVLILHESPDHSDDHRAEPLQQLGVGLVGVLAEVSDELGIRHPRRGISKLDFHAAG